MSKVLLYSLLYRTHGSAVTFFVNPNDFKMSPAVVATSAGKFHVSENLTCSFIVNAMSLKVEVKHTERIFYNSP